MDIVISPEIAILLLIILLAGFLSLYFLVGKRPKTYSNKILGFYFLFSSISFLIYFLNFTKSVSNEFIFIFKLLFFTIGVNIIYFYTRSIISTSFAFLKESKWHLTPFIISMILCIIYFSYKKIYYIESFHTLLFVFDILLLVVYFILTLLEIKKYELNRNQNFSNFEHKNLDWLKFILYAHIVYYIFPVTWGVLSSFTNIDPNFQNARIAAGSVTILFFLIILWKVTTYSDHTDPIEEKSLSNRYKSSNLEEKQKGDILQRLETYMQQVQPFLEGNVTLSDISNEINIPSRHVSQAINEELEQNFYEFINSHRIEYAKNLLHSTEKTDMTISEIMYASGFNSKSSFHTAFRKATNQTPTSFRNG